MNDFFNNRDKLIQMLIKQRCRYATKLSTKAQFEQYVSRDLNPREKTDEQKILEAEEELIRSLFPPRSQWVKLGKKLDRSKMDGESRNRLRLWKTYLLRKDKVSEEWVQRLNAFVYQLQQYIYYPNREKNLSYLSIRNIKKYQEMIVGNPPLNVVLFAPFGCLID